MDIFVTFPTESPDTITHLITDMKIGKGKFQVYKIYSCLHNTHFALKIFPNTSFGLRQHEKEMQIAQLRHTHIIRHIPFECHNDQLYATMMDYCEHGDFFEIAKKKLIDSTVLLRTYFHQLVAGIEYIHSQGIAHLDLKLDNLLLGSDMMLKIIDFDQAQPITDIELLSAGTTVYRAPEVADDTCKDFKAADVYSAAVILFTLRANRFPFVENTNPDSKYKISRYSTFLIENERFWKHHNRGDPDLFSEDLIELLNGMMNANAEERMTIQDIKNSKWYNGPLLDDESLKLTMSTKLNKPKSANLQMKNPCDA